MTDAERRRAAKEFAAYWKGKGYEKGESQKFWLSLLRDVLGEEHPERFISFEDQVHLDHTSFIDGYIDATKVLIEQKGLGKSLKKGIKQSNGAILSPFQQAQNYSAGLPYSKRPRWIVTCNFEEFLIYDTEKPTGEPESIMLSDLPREYYRLNFLTDTGSDSLRREMEISITAGDTIGRIYDAFLKQYANPDDAETLKSLNVLCVRLVFCFYAEDAGIFGDRLMFHDYLDDFETRHMRSALIELFKILDTKPEERDPYGDEKLNAFPYVNGGLFSDESIVIPRITEELRELILTRASADFDWSEISPTIFGAVFESTLNPETRRGGGMHYTSIENIHKVIDPLFLDDLTAELEEIKRESVKKTRDKRLDAFQDKLSKFGFLDPACGSGNFLAETYLSLRRLENEVLRIKTNQIELADTADIRVSIGQFYGIEINDFAVTVAKTALWIAESQMMKATEDIIHTTLDFLPLKSYANITEGNALRMDWETVVPKYKLSYIMGNPPFVGYSLQTKEQKVDILSVYTDEKGKPYKTAGKIDYVAGWYFKAAQLIQGTNIRAAFVSTNSITQGEQVAGVWKPLYGRFGIHIDFAHRTFRWDSEANIKAHVHCVIVGFSCSAGIEQGRLYENDRVQLVDNINAYLMDAPDIFIDTRSKPISNVPEMAKGSIPVDNGNFFITKEEYPEFIKIEPTAKKYIKKFYGAREFLHNEERWCLWLLNATPSDLKSMPHILQRIKNIREFRQNSTKAATRKFADYPTRFMEVRQPSSDYILVPSHSSENRKYLPIGFENADVICGNANLLIPNATLYHFGVLTSDVRMAWMRAVCGRLKSDYRYSNTIVYNNFPWPSPTAAQRDKIERTAQAVLDARALYPDSSLADLYDELTMPPELRHAHQNNDRAVLEAYGFTKESSEYGNEAACVAALMKMYREM